MLYNIDINECINKYLNYDNILLLRQTFKNNNKFKILKELKVIRSININDKIVFNDDDYLLKINLYTDDITKNLELLKNNMNIIKKKIYNINIKQKEIYKNENLYILCEFLKNINNIENLNTFNLNIYIISSLNRYLYKNNINLFNNLENLIIDGSNLEEKNMLHYINIIIEFLKKIKVKNVYFIKYNEIFEYLFKSYYNYFSYLNNNKKNYKIYFI